MMTRDHVLQTVIKASSLKDAANELQTNTSELSARIEKFGVKHERGEVWSHAVQDFLDAGEPQQLPLFDSSEK